MPAMPARAARDAGNSVGESLSTLRQRQCIVVFAALLALALIVAVIHAWQDMAVDVDQVQINISSSCVAWSTEARFRPASTEMAARTPLTTPFTSRTGLRIVL